MPKTPLSMNKPLTELKKLKLVLIFSTALSLSACAGLKPFPVKYVYEVDTKNKICGQYQITQVRPKLQFKHVKDLPLDVCNGVFGFATGEIAKVLDWADEAAGYAEQRCK